MCNVHPGSVRSCALITAPSHPKCNACSPSSARQKDTNMGQTPMRLLSTLWLEVVVCRNKHIDRAVASNTQAADGCCHHACREQLLQHAPC